VLADFGVSKRMEQVTGPTTAIQGTPVFMAPELLDLLENQRPKTLRDFQATDMWALGEISSQMLTGKATFQGRQLYEYCVGSRAFPSDQLQPSCDQHGVDFVHRLMVIEPSNRMTASQCLNHPWLERQRQNIESDLSDLTRLNLETGQEESSLLRSGDASARWTTVSGAEFGLLRPDANLGFETNASLSTETSRGPTSPLAIPASHDTVGRSPPVSHANLGHSRLESAPVAPMAEILLFEEKPRNTLRDHKIPLTS
jgi:serine/threonine protein kinase